MFKVEIKDISSQQVTHSAKFETTNIAQEWVDKIKSQVPCPWGLLEREKNVEDCTQEELDSALEIIPETTVPMMVEITPASVDPETSELIPAVYEESETETVVETPAKAVLPQTFEIIISNITSQIADKKSFQDKIKAGKQAREKCQKALDFVAGENLQRELTLEQITTMQTLFSDSESALRAGRPDLAKMLIAAIEPDETLITSELKQSVLDILNE